MSDTIVGLVASEILQREPDFVNPTSGLILDSAVIKGTSPLKETNSLTKTLTWTTQYSWQSHTHQESFGIYDFWLKRMGRLRSFHMPTWQADFKQSQQVTLGDRFITVFSNGFDVLYNNHSDRASNYTDPTADLTTRWGLLIIDKDDNKWYRQIKYPDGLTLNEPTPAEMKLNFSAEIGKDETLPAMDAGSIKLISLVPRVRAASTNFVMTFLTDGASTSQLALQEVFYESPIPA